MSKRSRTARLARSCCALAAQYGVRAVPTLVLDGEIVMAGVPDETTLRALGSRLGRDSQRLSLAR
ncbi:MAG: thioredoxin family protein [Chloroflexi bacterium]|nr:thioredoxin family protein [Chloroflexota bacterium]